MELRSSRLKSKSCNVSEVSVDSLCELFESCKVSEMLSHGDVSEMLCYEDVSESSAGFECVRNVLLSSDYLSPASK